MTRGDSLPPFAARCWSSYAAARPTPRRCRAAARSTPSAAIGNFLRARGARHETPLRLVPTRANGQPAFGCYFPCPHTEIARAYGLMVLTLAGSDIAEITFFADSSVFPQFGLPRSVPKQHG